jgi:DNA-binding PadR family transcriptional regulator
MPPVFGHGHLRLYLLSLLDEQPMHGYDLIQALGDRFGGTYVPSAGTIYPRLAKLEEEGLVTKSVDGRKTIYAITDAGRAELEARRGELDGIEDEVTDSVRRLANEVRTSVNDAMKSLRADLAAAARDARADANANGRNTRWVSDEPESAARSASRGYLQEAEVLLNSFRHELRSDLRERMSRSDLTGETIAILRSGLNEVSAAVRESLRNSTK